ncbi:MAG: hypothetical protein Q8K22_10455 [Rhodoferax sp.]|nr:hypothetical protein [Rhodoferax sp.]
MTEQDIESENLQLLTGKWKKLVMEKADPTRLGLSREAAQVLLQLGEDQVKRAATVHVPLFEFSCTTEILKEAFSSTSQQSEERNDDAQLFLSNRWRASEGTFVSTQMLYNMTRGMHALMQSATYTKIVRAGESGVRLMRLAVRPQYLFHAGNKFDLHTSHRTSMAICCADRSGY